MNFIRIFAVFLRQLFLIKSNPTRLVGIYIWLIIDIIQWGFISKYLGTFGQSTFSFVTVILGAIILWEFMTRIQQGIMTAFLEDVWSQNFINFFASPLKVSEYVAGLVLTSIATSVSGMLVMVLLAGLAFGYNILMIGLLLIPFLSILFIFGIAMGIFVSGLIFRLGPSAEWISWPIPFVLSIFSGVFYPISTLPDFFQIFTKIIPATYVFESVRAVLSQTASAPELWLNLIFGFGLSLAYLVLMYFFFIRVYRRNLKRGTLVRFNTE